MNPNDKVRWSAVCSQRKLMIYPWQTRFYIPSTGTMHLAVAACAVCNWMLSASSLCQKYVAIRFLGCSLDVQRHHGHGVYLVYGKLCFVSRAWIATVFRSFSLVLRLLLSTHVLLVYAWRWCGNCIPKQIAYHAAQWSCILANNVAKHDAICF